jgi:hypothetical protein
MVVRSTSSCVDDVWFMWWVGLWLGRIWDCKKWRIGKLELKNGEFGIVGLLTVLTYKQNIDNRSIVDR